MRRGMRGVEQDENGKVWNQEGVCKQKKKKTPTDLSVETLLRGDVGGGGG